jgi:hypothetical protein
MHAVQLQTKPAAESAAELNMFHNPLGCQSKGRVAGQFNTKRLIDLLKMNLRAKKRALL